MSTDAIGAYSKDTVYGQLTAPFIYENNNRNAYRIHINAHTPLDEPQEEKAVSLNDFRQNVSTDRLFKIEDFVETEVLGMKSEAVTQGLVHTINNEFPPKNVSSFSASELSKSDIVKGAIKSGYKPHQAILMARANAEYSKNIANPGSNVVNTLSAYNVTNNKIENSGMMYSGNATQSHWINGVTR